MRLRFIFNIRLLIDYYAVKVYRSDLKSSGNAFLPIFALTFKSAFITVPLLTLYNPLYILLSKIEITEG